MNTESSNNQPAATLLLAVYNQPEFLRRTLLGLARQEGAVFETRVCDDGSGQEIKGLLDELAPLLPGGLTHHWHPDEGFRKCRILNEGVRQSKSDHIIILDADCIPHRRFVAEHIAARREGTYLVGRRVMLSPTRTAHLTDKDVMSGRLERVWITDAFSSLMRKTRHLEAGLYAPRLQRLLDTLTGGKAPRLKGCNFSCSKGDLEKINGFDADYDSAGVGEDTDVERRFQLAGLTGRSVKHRAICFHQHHPIVSRAASIEKASSGSHDEQSFVCKNGLRDLG